MSKSTRSLSRRLAEISGRLSRCPDLDAVVTAALRGLDEELGYEHSLLLLLDEDGSRLFTIASHGYETAGIGSEVQVGEGIIGMTAARAAPMRVGNLRAMLQYARTVRREFEERGDLAPGWEIPLPGLAAAESQLAVPAMVLGQLVGVLAVETDEPMAFDDEDEALLAVIAGMVASAIEIDWAHERAEDPSALSGPTCASLPSRRTRRACGSSRWTAAPSSTATT